MRSRLFPITAVSLIATVLVAGCGKAPSDAHVIDEPATVEMVGAEIARITLTERAVQRLDIQTAPVRSDDGPLVVPSAAIFVDPDGVFWVYTNPEPLVFLRQEVGLVRQDGEDTFLFKGPAVGTDVVTVGVPELYGAEYGIDH